MVYSRSTVGAISWLSIVQQHAESTNDQYFINYLAKFFAARFFFKPARICESQAQMICENLSMTGNI